MTEIKKATRSGDTAIQASVWTDWIETARTAIASFRTERRRHRTLDQLAAFPPIVRRDVGGMDPSLDQ